MHCRASSLHAHFLFNAARQYNVQAQHTNMMAKQNSQAPTREGGSISSFMLTQRGLVGARSVPGQCPVGARYSARSVPGGKIPLFAIIDKEKRIY